jgi:transcriptional regulator with GAF, ATPase, and Fis domain
MKSAAQLKLSDGVEPIVQSEVMRKLMAMVERVAPHNASVLIVGETGSGKEMVARYIHSHSGRKDNTFIEINCAALPEHLLESELFGYEKGAFSGADSTKPGLFEMAEAGTILLDEIGELDPKFQAKLLRVLDGAPYYRLGGSRKISVNARVIAATNRDLEAEVRAGRFRMDLYHRLAQFQLQVPPLRERAADIRALANYFLGQQSPGSVFSQDAENALLSYSWPGNIRELKNVVFQAAMRSKAGNKEVHSFDLPNAIWKVPESAPAAEFRGSLEEMEERSILRALAENGGNQVLAARQLGISDRTLRRKLAKYKQGKVDSGDALGGMSPQQQRYFRLSMALPVTLTVDGEHLDATTVNISAGGLAIRTDTPLPSFQLSTVSFVLPATTFAIETEATLAWRGPDGTAGLNFVQLHPAHERELKKWLAERLMAEGWVEMPASDQ